MNRDRSHYPLMTIGIIGGGQLGKMMAQKAKKMGHVTILDRNLKRATEKAKEAKAALKVKTEVST